MNTNENFTMTCRVGEVPEPKVFWLKDSIPVELIGDQRYKQLPGGKLEIHGVQTSDEGEYHCVFENGHWKEYLQRYPYTVRGIRLMQGTSEKEGMVEVFEDQKWKLVCSLDWDDNEAAVVCKNLGISGRSKAVIMAYSGRRQISSGLSGLRCTGVEDSLFHCDRHLPMPRRQTGTAAGVACGLESAEEAIIERVNKRTITTFIPVTVVLCIFSAMLAVILMWFCVKKTRMQNQITHPELDDNQRVYYEIIANAQLLRSHSNLEPIPMLPPRQNGAIAYLDTQSNSGSVEPAEELPVSLRTDDYLPMGNATGRLDMLTNERHEIAVLVARMRLAVLNSQGQTFRLNEAGYLPMEPARLHNEPGYLPTEPIRPTNNPGFLPVELIRPNNNPGYPGYLPVERNTLSNEPGCHDAQSSTRPDQSVQRECIGNCCTNVLEHQSECTGDIKMPFRSDDAQAYLDMQWEPGQYANLKEPQSDDNIATEPCVYGNAPTCPDVLQDAKSGTLTHVRAERCFRLPRDRTT